MFNLIFILFFIDLIFYQGIDAIFKVCLILLGDHKELIMHCESFESIVEFLKTTLPSMGLVQMERIINQVSSQDRGGGEYHLTFCQQKFSRSCNNFLYFRSDLRDQNLIIFNLIFHYY